MLPDYGVVIGKYINHTTQQGQWMHVDLKIDAAGVPYQAAVDVNEPNGNFQYQVLNKLDLGFFAAISALSDGWHHLDSNPTSGAIDYARSLIFQNNVTTWTKVTGNEAGEALIAMVADSTKVFAFGAPYTAGNGVHDVHCNQGDPPSQFRHLDGIWQDGCVFVMKADGTLSVYLGMFITQSLNSDDNGLPK